MKREEKSREMSGDVDIFNNAIIICYMDRPTRLSFVIFGGMRDIFQSHQCFLETRSIANIAWHFYLSSFWSV